MSLTIRALLLFWPFFKRALFGDLTLKEVVLANLHISVVYICLLALVFMQAYTTVELSVVKSENIVFASNMCAKPNDHVVETLLRRRQIFGDLLK